MTASMGIAELRERTDLTWAKLVELADSRMYSAKHGGRDRIVACDPGLQKCDECVLHSFVRMVEV